MVELPAVLLVARPCASMVATEVLEDVQAAAELSFCVEPSLRVAVAVNCWVCPAAMLAVDGAMASDTMTAGPTVTLTPELTVV